MTEKLPERLDILYHIRYNIYRSEITLLYRNSQYSNEMKRRNIHARVCKKNIGN